MSVLEAEQDSKREERPDHEEKPGVGPVDTHLRSDEKQARRRDRSKKDEEDKELEGEDRIEIEPSSDDDGDDAQVHDHRRIDLNEIDVGEVSLEEELPALEVEGGVMIDVERVEENRKKGQHAEAAEE